MLGAADLNEGEFPVMSKPARSCPLSLSKVIDAYFMEHRAKLIDIAAFLDRCERAEDDLGGQDFRIAALRESAAMLFDDKPERARRILDLLSDPTLEPIASAAGMKGARGACAPPGQLQAQELSPLPSAKS